MMKIKPINNYKLTSTNTVEEVRNWIAAKDQTSKDKLITLIHHRFYNRYLKHVKGDVPGFLKMATACFIIETLESFRQGLPDTSRKSKAMFTKFFKAEKANFPGVYQIRGSFFKDIRCGILHQAETTNAWRIVKTGHLMDLKKRSYNADLFLGALEKSLETYINNLKNKPFDDQLWINAIKKLENVIENCKESPLEQN